MNSDGRIKVITLIAFIFIIEIFAHSAEYGDPCTTIEDCSDHRYNCLEDEFNTSRCLCNVFHKWLNDSVGCIQIVNTTDIMNETVHSEHDRAGRLEKIDDYVFNLILLAALFLLVVILVVVLMVIGYCIHMEKSDQALAKSLKDIIIVSKTK